MDRFYQNSGVGSPPPTSPSSGDYPTAGNPVTATPATRPGAYWFYMITESLRNVVVGAGKTPDKDNLNLLKEAIQQIVGDETASKLTPTATVSHFARTTAPAGWVRLRGGTIGSASSGASERAHADTHDLFVLLWNEFDNTAAPVIGGRGASAEADWTANKRITLFDDRGLFDRAFDDAATVNPAGTAIGGQQADALQGFKVQVPAATPAAYSGGGVGGTYMNLTADKAPISDGTNGTPRIANETRPKSRTYLKCIKL